MRHIQLVLGLLLSAVSLCDAVEAPSLTYETPIQVTAGSRALTDIVLNLRRDFTVNLIADTSLFDSKVNFDNSVFSAKEMFAVIYKSCGYDATIDKNTITLSSPQVKKIGNKLALFLPVGNIELTDVTVSQAIELIAQKYDIPLACKDFSHGLEAKRLSLHLDSATVEDDLNVLVKAFGLRGWSASISEILDKHGRQVISIAL